MFDMGELMKKAQELSTNMQEQQEQQSQQEPQSQLQQEQCLAPRYDAGCVR